MKRYILSYHKKGRPLRQNRYSYVYCSTDTLEQRACRLFATSLAPTLGEPAADHLNLANAIYYRYRGGRQRGIGRGIRTVRCRGTADYRAHHIVLRCRVAIALAATATQGAREPPQGRAQHHTAFQPSRAMDHHAREHHHLRLFLGRMRAGLFRCRRIPACSCLLLQPMPIAGMCRLWHRAE